jgi:hypothetical protein
VSAFGTLAALMARQKTGRGQKVEAALLRTAVAFNNPTLVEQQIVQPNRIATLNRGQTSAPSDLFRTRDGWIIAYAIGGPMFTRWAKLMGEDHWLTDPRFKDDLAHAATTARSSPSACRSGPPSVRRSRPWPSWRRPRFPPGRSTRPSRRSTTPRTPRADGAAA